MRDQLREASENGTTSSEKNDWESFKYSLKFEAFLNLPQVRSYTAQACDVVSTFLRILLLGVITVTSRRVAQNISEVK